MQAWKNWEEIAGVKNAGGKPYGKPNPYYTSRDPKVLPKIVL